MLNNAHNESVKRATALRDNLEVSFVRQNTIARKDPVITNVTEISVFVREVLKSNTFHNFDFNTTVHTTNKKLNDFLYI